MDIKDQTTVGSSAIIRNNRIFTIIFVVMEILFIFMYGWYIRPQAYTGSNGNGLFASTGIAILVLVGFGLYFTYLKHLTWSGLGFTFLITVITFQYYFLMNAFWNKARVYMGNDSFASDYKPVNVYLSEENGTNVTTHGDTAAGAFKAALSMVVAFMAILGRGGPLEAIIMIIFGVILYELNRQIITNFSVDVGGSMSIFCFGGFFGSAVAFILAKTRQSGDLERHPNYTSDKFNVSLALMGSAFCWVFFPVLNMDLPLGLFTRTLGGVSTIYCISSAVLTSVAISLICYGKMEYRDLITAPIAGGVIIGSSSAFIYNPIEAIILGIVAGGLQILFNRLDKKMGANPIFSNNVFFSFAIQGFLGGLASAIMRAINQTYGNYANNVSTLVTPYGVFDQRGQISGTFISLGIGLVSGLIVGLIIRCVNKEERNEYYTDATYWLLDEDGLSDQRGSGLGIEGEIHSGEEIKGEHAYL